jgi:hypothetical protein
MSDQTGQSQSKPVVFILNLDKEEMYEGLFDQIYSDLVGSLTSKYRLVRARTADAASRYFLNPENRQVVTLIVDPGVVKKANVSVLKLITEYVGRGGIVVFMASFSSFIQLDHMDNFWKK